VQAYDAQLGWLHAVPHGADHLGTAAAAGLASPEEVLGILARRIAAPAEMWQQLEEARIGVAILE